MRVIELYSGIGGMHLALKESGVKGCVITAIDINTTANCVYEHNFPATTLLNRNIESISSSFINELGVDTILMSPPCQPFTRNGLRGDVTDPRTKSFVHLLTILPCTNVRRILMENVQGFEDTELRRRFVKALRDSGFAYQEFILNPLQYKIPNSRPRYYCVAKKLPDSFSFETCSLMRELPRQPKKMREILVCDILEKEPTDDAYLIPDIFLLKRALALDICHPTSTKTCCFTKSYGRYVTGTGSVFTQKTKEDVDEVYASLGNADDNPEEYVDQMKQLELRFFTPREVGKLMSFPDSFSFPESITDRQKYMLLGNSVNVKIVSELIKLLEAFL